MQIQLALGQSARIAALARRSFVTLRWRGMDSNFWYRGTKAVDFRSIPGMAEDQRSS
jgi:hypothetical protein